jgi:hypothetical protein
VIAVRDGSVDSLLMSAKGMLKVSSAALVLHCLLLCVVKSFSYG